MFPRFVYKWPADQIDHRLGKQTVGCSLTNLDPKRSIGSHCVKPTPGPTYYTVEVLAPAE